MSNIQQTYNLLQQMYDLMNQIENKTETTDQKLQKTLTQATYLNQVLNKSLLLFRKMGLPEDIENIISKFHRLLMIINQVKLASVALYAGNPLLAGLSLLMVALDVGDMMMS